MGIEQRSGPRMRLKRPAQVRRGSARPIRGVTQDIGADGLSVMLPERLPDNEVVRVGLDLPLPSGLQHIELTARTVYAVCCGMQGFRMGMQIVECDELAQQALATLLSPQIDLGSSLQMP